MAETALLVSFLVGIGVLAVLGGVLGRGWRRYAPPEPEEGPSRLARAANDPAVWTVAFLVLALGVGAATVAFVGGFGEGLTAQVAPVLVGGAGALFTFYVYYGTFVSARRRGLKKSQAAAIGSFLLGLLGVVLVSVKLLGLV